jgi:hypothetical protein
MPGGDNTQVGLLTKAWGVAGFPYRFLFPCPARPESYDGTVARLLVVNIGQWGSGQLKTTSLDRILVGHDHHISVRVLFVKPACDFGDSSRQLGEALIGKVEMVRVFQIGVELAWK